MLKQRVITAIFIVMIFFGSLVFLSPFGFSIFFGAVLLVAAWEWANLSSFEAFWQRIVYCGAMFLAMFAVGCWINLFPFMGFSQAETGLNQPVVLSILLAAGTWWAVALLWVQGYPSSAVLWGNRWIRALMGLFVLIPSWLALAFLQSQPNGNWLILLIVLIVAVADTGAYFAGRAFGQRKLSEHVSPGKSWEGVLGGFLGCVLLAIIIASYIGFEHCLTLLAIILPTSLVSVLGDLLESMIKRHRGIKDSGRILPGHGGILDRIDALTAAAPIFALAIILSGWQLV